ncbi:PAS domain-containing sensor histidine kinase [Virgibacillus profundi]|uniref:histidine kinase n=1 Tax=Virgibacillus profundi TaxID=2024555 RepID=A0A2A2IGF7_9BACI|nr:HAMP domain-containing sensor histidine kinase [Virgibacillus profundi]PAV30406.1 PAS domain-containing sensor histidine kinase [Virgibacillus profundi]PXY54578.1 PAS domain S-box protein [Virgibacillus profundi]
MKPLFTRPLFAYVIGVLAVIILSGTVLSLVMDNYIVLISVLLAEFIILLLFLLHVYERHIKPIKKATNTVEEIVKGNFRARIHHTSTSHVGELIQKINKLARNLNELSIQEQMHSEQLTTVIDNTEGGLVLIDSKGYIHLVNRKFISMFGNTMKDYKGYLYYEVLDNKIIHETVQKTFLYEKSVKETFTNHNGNEKQYLEIVGAPIFNERNMLKGAVLVLYDITELKKLELMRKDFVANVSHELKTPITSIKGFAETLLENDMNDVKVNNEFLEIIYNESNRLQLIIEDLLTLSRLEREDFPLVLNKININVLVDEVMPVIKQKAMQKNLKISLSLDEDITFMADKEKVKQILINLLDNAVNYTSENGEISLHITSNDKFVHIKVSDTGIGIDEKALSRLFERFYRVDQARSRNTGGTGLGLAIVKHIVEVHEGTIEIDSEINKGTAIHIYLPKNISN